MDLRVIELKPADLIWGFDSKPPRWQGRPRTRYGGYTPDIEVDITPAYPHDVALVRERLELVYESFPLDVPVTVFVERWEEPSRTNGWAYQCWDHKSDDRRWEGIIGLPAKRIPIHPAMTRYVVAHEYGHLVDYWLSQVRDLDAGELHRQYAKLRGLGRGCNRYGPGRWHQNVGELIANDFRLLVPGVDLEFWPHPGIARPEELPAVVSFWRDALKEAA